MPNCEAVDLPDFRTPPIIEVVCGVRFVPLQDWVIPHVGAYWHRVRDRFPRVEHAQPLPGGIEIFDSTTNIPLPRIWLINETDDRLVQLQSGRFFFNWRHRGNDYPRFRNLYVEFCEMFNGFVEFVNENDLGDVSVEAFELTYINHVFEGDGWGLPEMIGKVVPHMGLSIGGGNFLPSPSSVNWQGGFRFPDSEGELSIKINPGTRSSDQTELLIIELTSRGRPAVSPIQNMDAWFGRAHEWIVRGFEEVTSEEAQVELWGKI